MAVREIVVVPNDILETPCDKVIKFDEDLKNLVNDLKDTLSITKNPTGAGLAAPQIGVLKQVCIVRKFFENQYGNNIETFAEFVLINPRIITHSGETEIDFEGCLSIPDSYANVERSSKIKVVAQNENGEKIKLTATGFFARTIQHEIDHLHGVLFTSKVIGEIYTEAQLDKILAQESYE